MYMLTIERSYILPLYVSIEISVLGGLLEIEIIKQGDFTFELLTIHLTRLTLLRIIISRGGVG